jgi:hypothetical protein
MRPLCPHANIMMHIKLSIGDQAVRNVLHRKRKTWIQSSLSADKSKAERPGPTFDDLVHAYGHQNPGDGS